MVHIEIDYTVFPPGKSHKDVEIRELLKVSHSKKCCYCESANIKGEVEHFRPKAHYPWLTDDYRNLLWACHGCNQHKAAQLPVERKMADAPDPVPVCDEKETLSMLNPSYDDKAIQSFQFDQQGYMSSKSKTASKTIEICKLNRVDLLDKRKEVLFNFEKIIMSAQHFVDEEKRLDFLKEMLLSPALERKDSSFIAFRKYIIRNWLRQMLE